jgi:hypothetical protein
MIWNAHRGFRILDPGFRIPDTGVKLHRPGSGSATLITTHNYNFIYCTVGNLTCRVPGVCLILMLRSIDEKPVPYLVPIC